MNRNCFHLIIASRYWNCFTKENLTQQTFLVFQDVFKTYLQYVFLKRLQDVSKTFLRRLPRRFQDVFKTYSRRVCKTSCNYVFKTSWKTKICYTEDVFKTSSRRLQYVLTKTNVCWEDALTLLSLL